PQVGKVTSKKIMEEIGINENRRVQGLGKRQINALLERLG
ncbi:MAG TPA: nucleoid-associated protein, partial [Limnochordia bacterium]|nr:nucleoid-associated protein [Limnochordia bacterium]